uniref:IS30 family transposase n=1 Tax=Leifsonia xyli TaxID=1575 RepID=UPI001EEE30BE|nr:IS30 family transposase [Leifsonia xyli]
MGKYRPFHAHRLARSRRARDRPGKIASNPRLQQEIRGLLKKYWSPVQICQHLRQQHPDDPSMRVVHETIYRDLYDYRGGALPRELCRMLRTKRDRRKAPRVIARRRIRFNAALTIHDRPFAPTDRSVPGAWEGDLIMGLGNRSAIATLVERTTRFTLLLPVDAVNRSESLRDQLVPALAALPPELRRSITWDQGWEMARHEEISRATGTRIYSCDPHSPWQRGSNENTNRLLRDYFPKRTDLRTHTPKELALVAAELNNRPRKILGWKTPNTLFKCCDHC